MKTVLLALTLLSSNIVFAGIEDSIGGVLTAKNRGTLHAECIKEVEDVCERIQFFNTNKDGEVEELAVLVLTEEASEAVVADARGRSRSSLNFKYVVAGTAATMAISILSGDGNGALLILSPVTVVIDIVKAPFVALAYGFHRLSDRFTKKQINKSFAFMLDASKKDQSKKIKKRYFDSIDGTLYENRYWE